MGGVYRRPPMAARTRRLDRRLAALRPAAAHASTSSCGCRPTTSCSALLDLAKAGIHPPDEMPFGVAWSTLPSPAFERGFLQHSLARAAAPGRPTHWALNLMVELGGRADRPQSLDAEALRDPPDGRHRSWLGPPFQGPASARRCAPPCSASPSTASARGRRDVGVPRQRGLERRVARARLRGERARQPGPGGRRARDPAVPDDGRGLAVPAAAAGRRSRASTRAATCSGSGREEPA